MDNAEGVGVSVAAVGVSVSTRPEVFVVSALSVVSSVFFFYVDKGLRLLASKES